MHSGVVLGQGHVMVAGGWGLVAGENSDGQRFAPAFSIYQPPTTSHQSPSVDMHLQVAGWDTPAQQEDEREADEEERRHQHEDVIVGEHRRLA